MPMMNSFLSISMSSKYQYWGLKVSNKKPHVSRASSSSTVSEFHGKSGIATIPDLRSLCPMSVSQAISVSRSDSSLRLKVGMEEVMIFANRFKRRIDSCWYASLLPVIRSCLSSFLICFLSALSTGPPLSPISASSTTSPQLNLQSSKICSGVAFSIVTWPESRSTVSKTVRIRLWNSSSFRNPRLSLSKLLNLSETAGVSSPSHSASSRKL
mmetsp:Transcript_12365/g.19500  ORF Transcript_12365/g.19500 Transcript_12365/m.19500 type:complete len:212 (-) Transcript_12365:668-1303(-)